MSSIAVQSRMIGGRATVGRRGGRVLITAEEEQRLSRAWREEGDAAARERLITGNLGLVIAIAQRYRNAGVPMDDLIAEGNLGLLSAVDGFDPDCGSRFSTYAVYWIRQGIGRAFAAGNPRGRLSARDRQGLAALERATRAIYGRAGVEPTDAELAEELGWPSERLAACKALHSSHTRPCSLDSARVETAGPAVHGAASGVPLSDEAQAAGATVQALLGNLSPFERSALELRFGLHGAAPHSVETIACTLDRTKGETRAALRVAMSKLARSGRSRNRLEASAACGVSAAQDEAGEE